MTIKVTGMGEKDKEKNMRGEQAKRSHRRGHGNEIQAQPHPSSDGFFRQPCGRQKEKKMELHVCFVSTSPSSVWLYCLLFQGENIPLRAIVQC